jgi:hypothetical protein
MELLDMIIISFMKFICSLYNNAAAVVTAYYFANIQTMKAWTDDPQ